VHNDTAKLLASTARALHQQRIWKQQVPPSINHRLVQLLHDIKPVGRPSRQFEDGRDEVLDTTREMLQQLVCDELSRSYNNNINLLQQTNNADRMSIEDEARHLLQGSKVTADEIQQVFDAARPATTTRGTSHAHPTLNPDDSSSDDDSDNDIMDTTVRSPKPVPLPPRAPKTPKRQHSSPTVNTPRSSRPRLASPPQATLNSAARQLFHEAASEVITANQSAPVPTATAPPTSSKPPTAQPSPVHSIIGSAATVVPPINSVACSPTTNFQLISPLRNPPSIPDRQTPPTPLSPEIRIITPPAGPPKCTTCAYQVDPDRFPTSTPSSPDTARPVPARLAAHQPPPTGQSIVILGDDNSRRWPLNDKRFYNASLDGTRLENAPQLIQRLLQSRPDVTAIVIALGLLDAAELGAGNSTSLVNQINQLAQIDSRVLFTALPEFDDATVVQGANIVLVNKTARKAFKDRFIPIVPGTVIDQHSLPRVPVFYGPATGRNIYSSVATFLNSCSFFSPLSPPLSIP
jgi:hypothetical protein